MIPGEYLLAGEPIELNSGRVARTITVANTGDRPIQVGSHFHFFEANRYLSFDRAAAYGCRLDTPAGASVRFEPGEERTVTVIPYAGTRHVWGFNGLVAGALDGPGAPEAALQRAREAGFAAPAEQGDDTR